MEWENILPSSIIAAIIGLLAGVISQNIGGRFKYITEERQKWRNEIRDICDGLNAAKNLTEVKVQLTKLKVRINAYGNKESDSENKKSASKKIDYKNDEHIWDLIHRIEKNEYNDVNKRNVQNLIEYLSFLLKHDWERSKAEVTSNRYSMFALIIFISSLVFAEAQVYICKCDNKKEIALTIAIVFSALFIISNVPLLFEKNSSCIEKISSCIEKISSCIEKISSCIFKCIFFIIIAVVSVLSIIALSLGFGIVFSPRIEAFFTRSLSLLDYYKILTTIIPVILLVLSIVINRYVRFSKCSLKKEYKDNLEKKFHLQSSKTKSKSPKTKK